MVYIYGSINLCVLQLMKAYNLAIEHELKESES